MISFVQSTHNNNGGGATTLVLTLGSAPTNGNSLFIFLASGSGVVTSITQTGSTWVRDVESRPDNTGTNVQIWHAFNISGAGTTITINNSSSDITIAVAMEFSGIGLNTITDKTAFVDQTAVSGSTVASGTTSGTTISNELWIAGWNQGGSVVFSAPTNGFTGLVQDANVATTGMVYKIVSSTGTASSNATTNTNSGAYEGAVATFGTPTNSPNSLMMMGIGT